MDGPIIGLGVIARSNEEKQSKAKKKKRRRRKEEEKQGMGIIYIYIYMYHSKGEEAFDLWLSQPNSTPKLLGPLSSM